MPLPGSEDAAEKVAAALTAAGLTVSGVALPFTRARWPKYAATDLNEPKAHVVPVWPTRMDPHDDKGVATETPLGVTFDARCEKTQLARVDELTSLLESIALFLAGKNIAGLGYPIEDIVIDRDDPVLDKGHFRAGIGVVYRLYRDHPDGDDE